MHERVCMSVCVCACVYELKVCSQAFCDLCNGPHEEMF